MRTLHKNKVKMKYALLVGETPVYELDDDGNKVVAYVDEDGNIYYKETGETALLYSEPIEFYANIAMSGGEVRETEFGLSNADYDAVVITDKDLIPIDETSLIWLKSDVAYRNIGEMILDANSADYRVRKVSESLNQTKYLLKSILK